MRQLLEKVRGLVPFVWDRSKVEFGGACEPPKGEFFMDTYSWQNGWRERGRLLLNEEGDPVGTVVHIYSSGIRDVAPREVEEHYSEEEAHYLLSYCVKFDTEEEEWAFLYRIEK